MAFTQGFKLIGEDCESLIKGFYSQISIAEKFKKCLDEINKIQHIIVEGFGGNMFSRRGYNNTEYVDYTYARDSIPWGGHKLYIDRCGRKYVKIHHNMGHLQTIGNIDYTTTGHIINCEEDPSKSAQYRYNPFYFESSTDFFIQYRKVYIEERSN